MTAIPESVSTAWDNRKGPAVFTTVNAEGVPNAIYVGCLSKYDEQTLLVADNYFDKTRRNILAGTRGSLLIITNEGKAFQFTGRVEYHKEGALFENMKTWNPAKHPGHAVAVLKVESVYSGADKLA